MLRWSGELTSEQFAADVDIDYMPPKENRIEPWQGSGYLREGSVTIGTEYITNHGKIIVVEINTHNTSSGDILFFNFVGINHFILNE
jgi:hypothetical protein